MRAISTVSWALLAVTLLPGPRVAAQPNAMPSFDCARATLPDEKLICGNPELAAADNKMVALFQRRLAQLTPDDRVHLVVEQRDWLVQRRGNCNLMPQAMVTATTAPRQTICLLTWFAGRLDYLEKAVSLGNRPAPDGNAEQLPPSTVNAEPQGATAMIRGIACKNLSATDVMDQRWDLDPETSPFGIPASRWTDEDFDVLKTRSMRCAPPGDASQPINTEFAVITFIDRQALQLRQAIKLHTEAAKTQAQLAAIESSWSAATPPHLSDSASGADEGKKARGQVEILLADDSPDSANGAWTKPNDSKSRPAGANERSALDGGFYDAHPVVLISMLIYVAVTGLICLTVVRPPLIRWYRSQWWFIRGTGPVDILFKQIGFRLSFEFFIYGLSCVFGALGGFLWVILRKRRVLAA
jgi:uncharacterized protein